MQGAFESFTIDPVPNDGESLMPRYPTSTQTIEQCPGRYSVSRALLTGRAEWVFNNSGGIRLFDYMLMVASAYSIRPNRFSICIIFFAENQLVRKGSRTLVTVFKIQIIHPLPNQNTGESEAKLLLSGLQRR